MTVQGLIDALEALPRELRELDVVTFDEHFCSDLCEVRTKNVWWPSERPFAVELRFAHQNPPE